MNAARGAPSNGEKGATTMNATTNEPLPRAAFSAAATTVAFMLAGDAHVTFESEKTGVHLTYNVRKAGQSATATSRVTHFVSVLTAPDHYEYLGCLYEGKVYAHGRRSKIGSDAKSHVAFAWVWKHLSSGRMPGSLAVYHEGRCGKCGRRLTTPESIERGLGPTCAEGV